MSALDKLLGRESNDAPKSPLGPLGGLLSTIISPEQLSQMTGDVTGMITYFKTSLDTVLRQNQTIIEQQILIMDKLGIEYGRRDDGNSRDGGNGSADPDA